MSFPLALLTLTRSAWTGAALAKYLEGAGHRVELRPSRKHAGKGSIFSTRTR